MSYTNSDVGGCCCGCTTTICAGYCGKNMANVLITIKSGGTTISSGTTDSSGCVALSIPSAGTYDVTSHVSTGFADATHSWALTCGGTQGNGFADPTTLSLTDSNRTITLTKTSMATWWGCYELSSANFATSVVHGGSASCCDGGGSPPTTGNCDIWYQLSCASGVWTLQRNWGACCWGATFCVGPFTAYYSTNGLQGSGANCNLGLPGGVDGPNTKTQSTISFPFTINLTLGVFGSIACPATDINSPLGTSVTIDL